MNLHTPIIVVCLFATSFASLNEQYITPTLSNPQGRDTRVFGFSQSENKNKNKNVGGNLNEFGMPVLYVAGGFSGTSNAVGFGRISSNNELRGTSGFNAQNGRSSPSIGFQHLSNNGEFGSRSSELTGFGVRSSAGKYHDDYDVSRGFTENFSSAEGFGRISQGDRSIENSFGRGGGISNTGGFDGISTAYKRPIQNERFDESFSSNNRVSSSSRGLGKIANDRRFNKFEEHLNGRLSTDNSGSSGRHEGISNTGSFHKAVRQSGTVHVASNFDRSEESSTEGFRENLNNNNNYNNDFGSLQQFGGISNGREFGGSSGSSTRFGGISESGKSSEDFVSFGKYRETYTTGLFDRASANSNAGREFDDSSSFAGRLDEHNVNESGESFKSTERLGVNVDQEHNINVNVDSFPAGFSTDNPCSDGKILNIEGVCVIPDVRTNLFVYASPERPFNQEVLPFELPAPKLNYNVVFIKTESSEDDEPIVVPPPQQKTIVYVLNKDSDNRGQQFIEIPAPIAHEPEVFYVNYKEGDNPQLPFGIDLKSALSSAINQEGRAVDDISNEFDDEASEGFGAGRGPSRGNEIFDVGKERGSVLENDRFSTVVNGKYGAESGSTEENVGSVRGNERLLIGKNGRLVGGNEGSVRGNEKERYNLEGRLEEEHERPVEENTRFLIRQNGGLLVGSGRSREDKERFTEGRNGKYLVGTESSEINGGFAAGRGLVQGREEFGLKSGSQGFQSQTSSLPSNLYNTPQ